jgi:hypothetical protein
MPEQVTVWSMPHTVTQSLSAAQDAATDLPADVSPTFKAAERSQQFLKSANNDPNAFLKQRTDFFHKLEQNPSYAGATKGWEARNADLRTEITKNNRGPDQIASVQKPHAPPKRNKYVAIPPNQRLKNRYT